MTSTPFRLPSLLAIALIALAQSVFALDTFIVARITDMDKTVEYRIMSPEEFKALETEIKAEASLFQKAEELAKKEWKADEGNKSTPFPPGLNPRKLEVLERSTSSEKANAKLEKLEDSESRRQVAPPKKGKLSDVEKKRAEAKAEREDALKKGHEAVKTKLAELQAKASGKDKAPNDKPEADKKP